MLRFPESMWHETPPREVVPPSSHSRITYHSMNVTYVTENNVQVICWSIPIDHFHLTTGASSNMQGGKVKQLKNIKEIPLTILILLPAFVTNKSLRCDICTLREDLFHSLDISCIHLRELSF